MKKTKIISILLCLCLALSTLIFASCDDESKGEPDIAASQQTTQAETENETEADTVSGEKTEYTVTVKSQGSLELGGIEFEVYADAECTSLRARGETNLKGEATFKLAASECYLKITSAPDGYRYDELYTITDTATSIQLESYIRDQAPTSDFRYQLGDVVHNFVLSGEGEDAVTVADTLEEYGCLVLNFWYIGCGPCKAEFPYIQSAYTQYSDKVGFFALNGNSAESDADIEAFMSQNNYTFPTGRADNGILSCFGISAFPTTVVIDKFGVVCLIEVGTAPDESVFVNTFDFFTSDSYTQTKFFDSLHDVPAK